MVLQTAPVRAVVRPISSGSARPCARPGCPAVATATLGFAYAERRAWLAPLSDVASPSTYDLCDTHAGRTSGPHGWTVEDRRPDDRGGAAVGGPATVALLARTLGRGAGRSDAAAPPAASEPAAAPTGQPEAERQGAPGAHAIGDTAPPLPGFTDAPHDEGPRTAQPPPGRAPLAVRRARSDA